MAETPLQTLVDVCLATVAWAVVVFKTRHIRGATRSARSFLLFMIGLAISSTLQVNALAVPLDEGSGHPNLSWWLSYIALTAGLCFLADTTNQITQRHHSLLRGIFALAIVTNIAFAALYPALCMAGQSYNHEAITNDVQLLFTLVFYIFTGAVLVSQTIIAFQTVRAEEHLASRLRSLTFAASISSATLWLLIKPVRVVLAYQMADAPITMLVQNLSSYFMVTVAISIVLALLPNRAYHWLVRKLTGLNEVLALLEILVLVRAMLPFQRPLVLDASSLHDQLRRPTFFLYRHVVYLYDCLHLLGEQQLPRPLALAIAQLPKREDQHKEAVAFCRKASRHYLYHRIVKRK